MKGVCTFTKEFFYELTLHLLGVEIICRCKNSLQQEVPESSVWRLETFTLIACPRLQAL